jgi:hypothetical protein
MIGATVVTGVGSVHVLAQNHKAKERKHIEAALTALFIQLSQMESCLRFEQLGASVFRKSWKISKGGAPAKRIIRFRPSGYPPISTIKWTTSKGAVGECFTKHIMVYRNHHEIANNYQHPVAQSEFDNVPDEIRDGFTRDEFNIIRPKYSEVIATPIFGKRDKIIGVLSVDRQFNRGSLNRELLGRQDVAAMIATTAANIGDILEPLEN